MSRQKYWPNRDKKLLKRSKLIWNSNLDWSICFRDDELIKKFSEANIIDLEEMIKNINDNANFAEGDEAENNSVENKATPSYLVDAEKEKNDPKVGQDNKPIEKINP